MAKYALEAYEGDKPYIFVSYAHKNTGEVLPIISALADAGYRVWYDEGIEAGSEWPEYIEDHLCNCQVVLVFISEYAVESINCRNEINLALSLKKDILVINLEPTQLRRGLALQLSSVQSIARYEMESSEELMREIFSATMLDSCADTSYEGNATEKAKAVGHNLSVQHNAQTTPLLRRVAIFLEDDDLVSADNYCEKVLDADPENAQAYLYKLCMEFKVHSPEKLTDLMISAEEIKASANYKKILQFGTDEQKNTINDLVTQNIQNKLEAAYNDAMSQKSAAKTCDDFFAAAELFVKIRDYKDSVDMIEECKLAAVDIKYRVAVKVMESAKASSDFANAANLFQRICDYRDYKDSVLHLEHCLQKTEELAELERIEEIISKAKRNLTGYETELMCKTIIDLLDTIPTSSETIALRNEYEKRLENLRQQHQSSADKLKQMRTEEKNKKKRKNRSLAISIAAIVIALISVILFVILCR